MMDLITEPFLRQALLVAVMLAGACAYLGNFVLMKRMTFLSAALSELAVFGVAVGMLSSIPAEFSSLLFTVLGALLFESYRGRQKGTTDALIGVVYAAGAAGAVLVMALYPRLESHGLNILEGSLLYTTRTDLVVIASIVAGGGIVHALFQKELIAASFDPETMQAQGIRTTRWNRLLLLSLALLIAVGMKLAGVLFIFASLIIPPLTALQFSLRVHQIFLLAVFFGVVSALCGMAWGLISDIPPAPAVVAVQTFFLVIVYLGRLILRR